MGVPIVKTRSVMHKVADPLPGRTTVLFERDADGEEDVPYRAVLLEISAWEDMDRPGVITVAIEPGDRLNED